jgi:hypothetical protein
MRKINIAIIAFFFTLSLVSCKKKELEQENTATVNMSGEWWVQIYSDDDTTIQFTFGDIEAPIVAVNTQKNVNTEILLDLHNFGPFGFKAVAPIDYATTSFKSNSKLLNIIDSTESVTLIEGKIFKNATTAPSLHSTDSIRLVFEYAADEGVKYIMKGYKDTGWPEDRH